MISQFDIYMLTRLDEIIKAMCAAQLVMIIITALLGLVFILFFIDAQPGGVKKKQIYCARKWFVIMCVATFVLSIIKASIPSTKEMAFIIVVPKIVNSEFVQERLPKEAGEIYEMAKQYTKQLLENKDEHITVGRADKEAQ